MATIERHMAKDMVKLDVGASCAEAAGLMKERKIGSVAVTEGGQVVGLVAERDLALRLVADGAPPSTRLGDIVNREGPSVGPKASEKECSDLMYRHHCRHLLVKDGDAVIGLISMRDVIVLMLDEKEHVIQQLEGYISGH